VLLNMLLLLQRNAGDSTVEEIFEANREKAMVEDILRFNEIYDEIMNNTAEVKLGDKDKTVDNAAISEADFREPLNRKL
jgi:hypothetical protein